MSDIIKFIALIFAAFLFASCNGEINFPEGGYSYPAIHEKSIKDSFRASYYGNFWNSAYNEPDLRLKPMDQTIIRLVYGTAFGGTVILVMTKNEIVIKQPIQGKEYPELDSTKLDKLERLHLRILERNFPFQELEPNSLRKNKMDSLSKIYSELLDPNYYKQLLDKSLTFDTPQFKYSTKKVKISNSKYIDIVNQINSSGYWTLPLHIQCDDDYLDGYFFRLEINTPKKYNSVGLSNCPEKALSFSKACQAIIDASSLGKKISVVPEN